VSRVTRNALATLIVLVALGSAISACSAGPSATPGSLATASLSAPASATPGADVPTSPVDGVLINIDSGGLSDVSGFALRTNDGTQLVFKLGVLENGTEFPPGHLAEHLATSAPIRVFFRPEGGDLVVYRIEDAP
jgi:hypothetical protein